LPIHVKVAIGRYINRGDIAGKPADLLFERRSAVLLQGSKKI